MRICFFADSQSIHTIRWCNYFLVKGHEIHLISFSESSIPDIFNYKIHAGEINLQGGNKQVLFQFGKVRKLLKKIKPDVFHAHYATSYGITGALCNFHPYFITALGTDILISPKTSKLYRILLRFALKKADLVTVMSKQMKQETMNLGVPSSKLTVLPFGIERKTFYATERPTSKKPFVIISTRNLEKVYNIPHLLKAVAQVKEVIPDLKVIVTGQGSQEQELRKMSHDLGIDKIVEFKGWVTQIQMAELLNQSHVFVSLSLSDGNNISLNEAMACETFCIATDIPANQEWVEDGANGFMVPIDDVDTLAKRLVESYQNYDELQSIAIPINQKLLDEKGIWENNMKRMEDIYKTILVK